MRQHNIEMNWRVNPIRSPKVKIVSLKFPLTLALQVLKGHDDHVITCLQFSGNRIVSGSDDNTLKVPNPPTLHNCFMWFHLRCGLLWRVNASAHWLVTQVDYQHTLFVTQAHLNWCVNYEVHFTSTIKCTSGGVWSSQMANNVIVSGSTDRTLKVSNLSAVD